MPWWGWLALGAAMLAAEAAVQTEFWLAIVGVAALTLGLAGSFGLEAPVWAQWAAFGVLAVGFNVFFRRRLHERLAGRAPGLEDDLIGESGVAVEAIEPGAIGSVELRGSTWRARNVGEAVLPPQTTIRVEARDGILLDVRG